MKNIKYPSIEEVKKAHERGAKIYYLSSEGEWKLTREPRFNAQRKYRIEESK